MRWTRGALRAVVVVVCLVVAGAAAREGGLHLLRDEGKPPPATQPARRVTVRRVRVAPIVAQHHGHASTLVVVVVGIAIALAVLAVAAVVGQLLRRAGWHFRLPTFALDPAEEQGAAEPVPDAELVVQSALAALAALDAGADPRTAVIAAYAGMVAALDAAGTDGVAVLTPARLLDRAAAAGLVGGDDAGALTALFERARFSTHEITTADVDDARTRLDAVRARLATAVPA